VGERQLPFHGGSGSKPQALAKVGGFQVRIRLEDLAIGAASGQEAKNSRHGNPQMPNAWYATHLGRVDGNALEVRHCFIVRAGIFQCNSARPKRK
jgi:hypothetical protein